MEYFVLIIIYLTLYFREDLSKMEYLVLIIIYLTLYFREDLSKMEYLGCCLKEALRLHSPVRFQVRICLVCIPWDLPTHVGCDVDYTDGQ
jgi:hypothetical protein